MPIVNGKYQNPGWVNGQRPAIDAAELNAISDTLERLDEAPVLPSLTNPGTAADLLSGKQLIDTNGNVLTGTMPIAIQEIIKEYQRQKTNQRSRKGGSARKPQQYHAEAEVII